ncbi:MAG TPA: hypothetical protein VIJ79_12435 [Acidobacteriaceae bacterium]
MALEKELAAYHAKLAELVLQEGKFALLHGDEFIEVFSSYEDALKVGYARFGLDPFLVKQIMAIEETQFISRFSAPVLMAAAE